MRVALFLAALAVSGCAMSPDQARQAQPMTLFDAACANPGMYSPEARYNAARELENRGLSCQYIAQMMLAIRAGNPPPPQPTPYQLPQQRSSAFQTPYQPSTAGIIGVLQSTTPTRTVTGMSANSCLYLVNGSRVEVIEQGACPATRNFR